LLKLRDDEARRADQQAGLQPVSDKERRRIERKPRGGNRRRLRR
jgi:hypothetical protein